MWYLFSKQTEHKVMGKKIIMLSFRQWYLEEGILTCPKSVPPRMEEERPKIK